MPRRITNGSSTSSGSTTVPSMYVMRVLVSLARRPAPVHRRFAVGPPLPRRDWDHSLARPVTAASTPCSPTCQALSGLRAPARHIVLLHFALAGLTAIALEDAFALAAGERTHGAAVPVAARSPHSSWCRDRDCSRRREGIALGGLIDLRLKSVTPALVGLPGQRYRRPCSPPARCACPGPAAADCLHRDRPGRVGDSLRLLETVDQTFCDGAGDRFPAGAQR